MHCWWARSVIAWGKVRVRAGKVKPLARAAPRQFQITLPLPLGGLFQRALFTPVEALHPLSRDLGEDGVDLRLLVLRLARLVAGAHRRPLLAQPPALRAGGGATGGSVVEPRLLLGKRPRPFGLHHGASLETVDETTEADQD